MEFIDTHTHLNLHDFKKDLSEVIERAKRAGIIKCIVVGIDRKSGERALELKKLYPEYIEIALGFHPHGVKSLREEDYKWLEENLNEAIALGEIGLDWVKEYSPKEEQIKHFERLLNLAFKYQKPVILHLRGDTSFWKFVFDFLRSYKDFPFLFHCFTADKETALKILEFNSLISIPGVITFDNAQSLREAIGVIPMERLVLETDCPFLSPVPMRGKRNEPAYLIYIGEKLAYLKGVELKDIAYYTTQNALRFFKIDSLKET